MNNLKRVERFLPAAPVPTRSFSLRVYLLIVFGLSWPFLIASALWAGGNLLPTYLLNISAMVMVTVGTYFAGRYVFRDGFAGAGWSWGKPRYYLAVIGLALLVWVVPTILDVALGLSKLPVRLTPSQITWVFVLLFLTLIPGFGEEFGWRGYMLPRLARRYGTRQGVLLHGAIWWAWHIPVLVGAAAAYGSGPLWSGGPDASVLMTVLVLLAIGFIPTVLHAVVFAYIWSRTGSLAVSTVYHTAYDGIRDSLATTIGLGPTAGLWSGLLILVLGAVLLWRSKWKGIRGTDDHSNLRMTATDQNRPLGSSA
jgi:membrane protease YdiL (CAAX protease family)